jgi:threonyl-tRNA synthetase
MRFLVWHVNEFKSTLTQKGRSKLVEEKDPAVLEVKDAIVVFTAVENTDEVDPPHIVQQAVAEIEKICEQLKAKVIVIHSFAHLFVEKLAEPAIAIEIMKSITEILSQKDYSAYRTPFGWFSELDIKAKGHPLSRIARTIN